MRSRFAVDSLILVLLAMPCAASGARMETPRFQSLNPYRAAPLWIAAEEALTPEGTLREGAIAPAEVVSLENAFKLYERQKANLDPSACGVTRGSAQDFAPGMEIAQSWDDVRERARTGVVISGVVVESKVGFYAGAPSTLLRIDAKRSNRALPYDAYLVYPRGSVIINGVRVCTYDPAYADVPAAGDRILFVASQPLDESGTLFGPPAELIFYERGERLVPSPAARRRGLVPFRALDDFIRALTKGTRNTATRRWRCTTSCPKGAMRTA
jgi:hypothetical protein